MDTITETDLPIPLFRRGKVRDTYDLGDSLLMVATDRISAFDVIFREGIPCKGMVLAELSLFWFDYLKGIVDNHLITAKIPDSLKKYNGVDLNTLYDFRVASLKQDQNVSMVFESKSKMA